MVRKALSSFIVVCLVLIAAHSHASWSPAWPVDIVDIQPADGVTYTTAEVPKIWVTFLDRDAWSNSRPYWQQYDTVKEQSVSAIIRRADGTASYQMGSSLEYIGQGQYRAEFGLGYSLAAGEHEVFFIADDDNDVSPQNNPSLPSILADDEPPTDTENVQLSIGPYTFTVVPVPTPTPGPTTHYATIGGSSDSENNAMYNAAMPVYVSVDATPVPYYGTKMVLRHHNHGTLQDPPPGTWSYARSYYEVERQTGTGTGTFEIPNNGKKIDNTEIVFFGEGRFRARAKKVWYDSNDVVVQETQFSDYDDCPVATVYKAKITSVYQGDIDIGDPEHDGELITVPFGPSMPFNDRIKVRVEADPEIADWRGGPLEVMVRRVDIDNPGMDSNDLETTDADLDLVYETDRNHDTPYTKSGSFWDGEGIDNPYTTDQRKMMRITEEDSAADFVMSLLSKPVGSNYVFIAAGNTDNVDNAGMNPDATSISPYLPAFHDNTAEYIVANPFDLDVDSNNTNDTDGNPPDGTSEEEDTEETLPGRIVFVNNDNDDDDDFSDLMDGWNHTIADGDDVNEEEDDFVRVDVKFHEKVLLNDDSKIRFHYKGNQPIMGGGGYHPYHIKLWQKEGDVRRDGRALPTGDQVLPDTWYRIGDFSYLADNTLSLWIEGVSATGSEGTDIIAYFDVDADGNDDYEDRVVLTVEDEGCGCSGGSIAGVAPCNPKAGELCPSLGSMRTILSMGEDLEGDSAGSIILHSEQDSWGPDLGTEKGLYFVGSHTTNDVIDVNGALRQIKSPQALANIIGYTPDDSDGFEVEFYLDADVGAKDGNGFYTVTGNPFISWDFDVDTNAKTVTITEGHLSPGETARVFKYEFFTGTGVDNYWTITSGNGTDYAFKEKVTWADRVGGGREKVHQFIDVLDNNRVVKNEKTLYNAEMQVEQSITDPGGANLATQYYYDSQYRTKAISYPDGSWIIQEYDEDDRLILTVSPFGDGELDLERFDDPAEKQDYLDENRYSTYTYDDIDDPGIDNSTEESTTTVEYLLGEEIGTTWSISGYNSTADRDVRIREQAFSQVSGYGAVNNPSTVTWIYPEGHALEGKTEKIEHSDGTLTTYAYETGTFDLDGGDDPTFTSGVGTDERTLITTGTNVSPDGYAYKTTRETYVVDIDGNTLMEETYLYDGTDHDTRLSWVAYEFESTFGLPYKTYRSDGTVTTLGYDGVRRAYQIDAAGVRTEFGYDSLGRMTAQTKKGYAGGYTLPNSASADAQTDLITRSVLGWSGNVVESTVENQSGTKSLLSSKREYDAAGRVVKEYGPGAEYYTSYSYGLTTEGGRKVTRTRPDGETEISEYYRDGQMKKVSGTGVVHQYYESGVDTFGNQWSLTRTGQDSVTGLVEDSPRYQKTTRDFLGRTWKVERPASESDCAPCSPTPVVTQYTYNSLGRLTKTVTTPGTTQIYEHDAMGNVIRQGIDLNGTAGLQDASTDQITETESLYSQGQGNGEWYLRQRTYTFADTSATAPAIVSDSSQRITFTVGGGTERLVGETIDRRYVGPNRYEQTVSRQYVDPSHKLRRSVVDTPKSNNDTLSISLNGLSVYSEDEVGNCGEQHYNDLGQLASVEDIDGRITSFTYDDDTGARLEVTDPNSVVTEYGYDESTGRIDSVTQAKDAALETVTYYDYDAYGRQYRTWGSGTQPSETIFDDYGQMTELHTWQEDTSVDWTTDTWPNTSSITTQVTEWQYEEATGLLLKKVYGEGVYSPESKVEYTYSTGGHLKSEKHAEGPTGSEVVAKEILYTNDALGRVTHINYVDHGSANTPDVTFTYDRLNRVASAEQDDGAETMTHTFTYLGDGSVQGWEGPYPLYTEDITGDLYSKTIYREYDTGTGSVPGHFRGIMVGSSSEYNVDYGYDTLGRLSTVDVQSSIESHQGLEAEFEYEYHDANRDRRIWKRLDETRSNVHTSRLFETERQYLTRSTTNGAGGTVYQVDYLYDDLGRREKLKEQVVDAPSGYQTHAGYNSYSEVTSWARYMGTDFQNPGADKYPHYDFDYDAIGNREDVDITDSGGTTNVDYTANVLNQYTAAGSASPVYDESGNLLDDGAYAYTWDGAGRLIEVAPKSPSTGDKMVIYEYDYMSRRKRRQVINYDGSAWETGSPDSDTIYVNHSMQCLEELDNLNSDTPIRAYAWGLDVAGRLDLADSPFMSMAGAGGVGGLLCMVTAESGKVGTYQMTYDGNGNIVKLLNASGSQMVLYRYGPFGEDLLNVPHYVHNPFRFSTKFNETAMDGNSTAPPELYDYGFRWYHADLGRWTARDPIGEIGGNNLYAYVHNDPLILLDIQGLSPFYAIARTNDPRDPDYKPWPTTLPAYASLLPTAKDWVNHVKWRKSASRYSWYLTNASKHLHHYLDNTGTDYTIDIDDFLSTSLLRANEPHRIAEEAAKAQEFIESKSAPFGLHSFASREKLSYQYSKAESIDWFFAMNWYAGWGEGSYVKPSCGTCMYRMNFSFNIVDYYDWDDSTFTYPSDLLSGDLWPFNDQAELARLHGVGLAKAFYMHGCATFHVMWKRGTRVNGGHIGAAIGYFNARGAIGDPPLEGDIHVRRIK